MTTSKNGTTKDNNRYQVEYDSFQAWLKGERIPVRSLLILIAKAVPSMLELLVRYVPGPIGYKLRYYYFKPLLKHLGENVLIDVGVTLAGAKNISIGDYTWIDAYARLEAVLGEISIGKRVHIAPFTILAAREPVVVEDYVAISSGARIYANTEVPKDGKRMSGPMVPEEFKAYDSRKIVLGKDSFVGANSVLLPGAELGEGVVVGANTLVRRKVAPYSIVFGPTGKVIGVRERVRSPEL